MTANPNSTASPNVLPFRQAANGCARMTEFLPWLLNGSLDESETAEVRRHVASCDGCRAELRQAVDLWRLMDEHPSSMDLAWFAEDPSALDEASRAEVEQHLESCPECRALVDPASKTRLAPRPAEVPAAVARSVTARPAVRRHAQRWLSLAASIAALTLLGALWLVTGSSDRYSTEQASQAATQGEPESLIRAMDWESGSVPLDGIEADSEVAPVPELASAPPSENSQGAILSSFDFESGELPTGI